MNRRGKSIGKFRSLSACRKEIVRLLAMPRIDGKLPDDVYNELCSISFDYFLLEGRKQYKNYKISDHDIRSAVSSFMIGLRTACSGVVNPGAISLILGRYLNKLLIKAPDDRKLVYTKNGAAPAHLISTVVCCMGSLNQYKDTIPDDTLRHNINTNLLTETKDTILQTIGNIIWNLDGEANGVLFHALLCGTSYADILKMFGYKSEGAIKTHVHRGKAKIKETLEHIGIGRDAIHLFCETENNMIPVTCYDRYPAMSVNDSYDNRIYHRST